MEKAVPSVPISLVPAVDLTSLSHPADTLDAASPSSNTYLNHTSSATNTPTAINNKPDVIIHTESPETAIPMQGIHPTEFNAIEHEVVIDLTTVSSPENLQTSEAMDTETSDNNIGSQSEKSSYELAAEALCLMKSGGIGIKPATDQTEIVYHVKENPHAQLNVFDCHNSCEQKSLATTFGTEDRVSQNFVASAYTATTGVDVGNIQSIADYSNKLVHVNGNGQSGMQSVSTVHPEISTLTLPNESVSEPSVNVASSSTCISGDLVKYVLVPESALLASIIPGELTTLPNSPYVIVLPKDKSQAASKFRVSDLQAFCQGQRQLLPKGYPVSAAVNVNGDQCAVDESLNSDDFTLPTTKETKSASIKRVAKKHDALKFPPCIICDGEASGFHYGCNTCEACKNFFRRCLLRKSSTPFICHIGKNCEISYKKNKNNCSACRLDKCIGMGMAKEKCKMGRYTALMRTETIKKVRQLEGKDNENLDSLLADSPGASFGEEKDLSQQTEAVSTAAMSTGIRSYYDEMISRQIYNSTQLPEQVTSHEYNEEMINYLISAMDEIKPWGENLVTEESRKIVMKEHYEKYKAKIETFGQLNAVPMQEYQFLLRKFGIDIDGQWETFKQSMFDWEAVVGRYCKFAKCIPEFRSLSFEDQACLLKATHFDFFTIALHLGYIPEFGTYLEINGVPLHIEEAADKFFSRDLVLAMTEMMARLQKMQLSKVEMALLMSIVTMSTDQCSLENPLLVESTQLHLVDLLVRDTNKMYGQHAGRKRFTSVIEVLTKMRDVSNIYYKEYRALCKDDLIRKEVPNIDVFGFSNEKD